MEFSELQEQFYRDQHLDGREFSGSLWSQRLIEFLWREAHILWKTRNKQVHDEDGHKQSARELEEAKTKLRAMYANKQALQAIDQDLLPGRVEEMLTRNPSQIIAFVSSTYEIFKFCLQDAQRAVIAGSRDIRDYFPSANVGNQGRQIREQEAIRQAAAKTSRAKRDRSRPRRARRKSMKPKKVRRRSGPRPTKAARNKKITSWVDYFRTTSTQPSSTEPEIPEDREPPDPQSEERR